MLRENNINIKNPIKYIVCFIASINCSFQPLIHQLITVNKVRRDSTTFLQRRSTCSLGSKVLLIVPILLFASPSCVITLT